MVLTPADAKGLEYQSVCVLDPGRLLAQLKAATGSMATAKSQGAAELEHRTAIDQLRVALSRATETLAFVDVAGDDDAHALSAELLEDAAPYHADDLVESVADAPCTTRELGRTTRCMLKSIRPQGGRFWLFQDRWDIVWRWLRRQVPGRRRLSRFCRLSATDLHLRERSCRLRLRPPGRASAPTGPCLPLRSLLISVPARSRPRVGRSKRTRFPVSSAPVPCGSGPRLARIRGQR